MNMNTNTTTDNGLSSTVVTYYDRKLIKNAKPRLVHQRFGQKRQVPKNGGKNVSFRKFEIFPAATTPISEGVTPDGRALDMTSITADLKQYGDYVAGSDLLELTAIDQVLDETFELLGDQAGLTLDHITRDIIHQGSSVQYANSKLARYELEPGDVLTSDEIKKAVRTLKRNKAKPFMRNGRPYYVAIIDQDSAYDLMCDEQWQKVAEYQNAEKIEDGEIGKLFGVVFVETPEAKKFGCTPLSKQNSALTVSTYVGATKIVGISEELTEEDAAALVGRQVVIHNAETDTRKSARVKKAVAGTGGEGYIQLETSLGFDPEAGDMVYDADCGADNGEINSTIIFGKDAFGVVDIEGEDTFKTIFKPKGSAGTGDPLDQRWTAGWKASGFTAAILQDLWMVRIEHGFTR
ncbi:MAG: N4-gp56 family major capsid protein [Clostridia bacterium]|nr:N4-gp56 family major capsid protein [Clostridia bacterium]